MALGPFTSYSPPGIYVRTLAEANVSNVVAGLRLPVIIGVGQEELETLDLELVRGSSATVDQKITAEDVSLAWVVDATNPQNLVLGAQDGTRTQFRVRNFPITTGEAGRVANDIRYVMVTVNGLPVAVSSVQGAKGLVTLQVPTQPTDVVRCTYNFHRGDTVFTDNVSSQVSTATAQLTTPAAEPYNIVFNTTDKFILFVDGAKYSIPLTPNTGTTAAQLKSQIDAVLIPGLTTSVFVDNNGLNRVQFNSAVSLRVGDGNANGTLGFTNGAQTSRNNVFRVYQRPMVDGSSGGVITTDPSKCVVKVNNVQVVPTTVDGTNGLVTLASPPAAGSVVTIQYYSNTWQDTFDYLPNTMVTSVIRAGISAQRSDYIQGQDFVISNPTPDVSIINWGTGFSVSPTRTTVGATPFDKRQIIPTLIDQQMFLANCVRVVDTSVIPARTSDTEFLLPEVPTAGNGRNSTLGTELYNSVTNGRVDLVNNRPDLVRAYSGRTLRDALNRGVLAVVAVEGPARKITLKNPVPPDHNVYATFYYNKVADDTYLMTCSTPGAVGVGQYNVYSTIHGENLYQVKFGTKTGLAETVQWPRGVETIPDAFHTGAGTPVSETVTVTFGSDAATNAVYTNKGAGPWSFYSSSNNWVTKLNGTDYTSNLNAAAKGFLVSKRVKLVGGNVSSDGLSATTFSSSNNAFNITVDGVDVAVSLGTGTKTPAAIVSAINGAIDAVVPFSPGPNNLAATYQISGGDVFFVISSFSTPASLPGGFDHKSYVRVRQGTAEALIGYSTFQRANGTPKAINKPATVIGSFAGPFNIVAGVNDSLQFRVNGVDYTVSLTSIAGTSVAASTVVTTINATPGLSGVASVGTLDNLNKIRLTSQTNDAQSQILMGNGTANTLFGFTQGQLVTQTLVDPQEVVDALMSTANFTNDGVAYVSTYNDQKYITIESLTTGATGSSVAFTASAQSAFNRLTGVNITAGVDGDVGEDARDNFTVSSTNANGSAGKGAPGQTYTDAQTGLRFTVLPSSTGSYTSSGSFTMSVSQTFDVNPAVPTYAVPGLETIVSDTFGVGLGDVSTLQTFNPGGLEPANGDTYFVSYRYMKQEFDTRIFQQLKTIEANFGRTSAENRATLGAYLAVLNGALLVAVKQVLKAPNTNQATDTAFNQAIADLSKPLPGNVRPDIIAPLATSTAVYSFLTNHCETMSNIRFQSERMGFLGFASGTTPTSAQTVARSLNSNRMVVFYPDSGVIPLTDEQGTTFETLVDGSFFAAAASGAVVSPAVDVATPYTRRRILGFSRIPRVLDPVEANQVAVAGVVVLEDLQSVIRIRQGFTTRMESPLTRLPTVTQIADFVQQQSRTTLDAFVGSKFLASRTNEVEVAMTAMLKQLIQAEIIGAFTGVTASVDSSDQTVMQFEAAYQPIFPLLYIVVTFNLRAQIGTA
jgi:hypothetical protein